MDSPDKSSSAWLSFRDWLEQQRGDSDDQGQGASPSPSSHLPPLPPSVHPTTNPTPSDQPSTSTPTPTPLPPRRPGSSVSAALARDCRAETRLLDGYARGRQDMSIMLAAPGMPLHKSPLVTTRQATSLLTALWEPLVQVPVGRMTRKLESPTLLHPTQDKGVLSLWLLPNDDLSLVWQGRPSSSECSSASASATSTFTSTSTDATDATDATDVEISGTEVTVWEELCRFPAGAHPGSNDSVITIHMLRGDASGRSFYIRPRGDVAAMANAEAAMVGGSSLTTAVDAQLGGSHGMSLAATSPASSPPTGAMEEGRRMYFWLTGPDLSAAIRSLGRLKSLIKRPPTLAKRSGVSQRQLNQIASWLQQLDRNNGSVAEQAQQQQVAAAPAAVETEGEQQQHDTSNHVTAILGRHVHAPVHTLNAANIPTTITTINNNTNTTSQQQVQQQETGASASATERVGATGAVSATAAAVYRDRRFRISFPCSITVGASVAATGLPVSPSVPATGAAAKELATVATHHAKMVAEETARRTVDRIGRRNLEECICESLIRSVRAQRAKAKAEIQAQRDRQVRAQQAQQVQPLIKRAVEHATAAGGGGCSAVSWRCMSPPLLLPFPLLLLLSRGVQWT